MNGPCVTWSLEQIEHVINEFVRRTGFDRYGADDIITVFRRDAERKDEQPTTKRETMTPRDLAEEIRACLRPIEIRAPQTPIVGDVRAWQICSLCLVTMALLDDAAAAKRSQEDEHDACEEMLREIVDGLEAEKRKHYSNAARDRSDVQSHTITAAIMAAIGIVQTRANAYRARTKNQMTEGDSA